MLQCLFRVMLGGAIALVFFLPATVTHALSLAPSIIEAQMNPGETKTFSLTVTNDEQQPLRLYPSIQKFLPLGTEGQQQFLPPTDLTGLPSWTFIGVTDRLLQPGEKQVVPIQIRVPADAPEGGLYEALFLSSQPPVQDRAAVGIRSRIGVLVLLTVGNTTTSELTVADWRLLESTRQTALTGTVRVGLRNVGRTHVTPKGEIVVRGTFGNEVMRLPLNPAQSRVLPTSERVFDVELGPDSARAMKKGLRGELAAFGIGRYSLRLEGVEGLRVPPSPLYLTVFPWRMVSLLAICIIFVAGVFRVYRRRLIRALQNRQT